MPLGRACGGGESRKGQCREGMGRRAFRRQPADPDARERESDTWLCRDDGKRDRYGKSARDQPEGVDRSGWMGCGEYRKARDAERRVRPELSERHRPWNAVVVAHLTDPPDHPAERKTYEEHRVAEPADRCEQE